MGWPFEMGLWVVPVVSQGDSQICIWGQLQADWSTWPGGSRLEEFTSVLWEASSSSRPAWPEHSWTGLHREALKAPSRRPALGWHSTISIKQDWWASHKSAKIKGWGANLPHNRGSKSPCKGGVQKGRKPVTVWAAGRKNFSCTGKQFGDMYQYPSTYLDLVKIWTNFASEIKSKKIHPKDGKHVM